jgi:AraC-type DNA-binding domain-containing proteins
MDGGYVFEQIEYVKDVPLKCFIAGIDYSSSHWHPDIEIVFLLKGKLRLLVDGEDFIMEEGDIILINSKSVHSVKSETDNLAMVLQFLPNIFQPDYKENSFYFHINSKADEKRQPKDLKQLQRILAQIGKEVFTKADGFQYYINSYFYQLVGHIFRYSRYDTINKAVTKVRDVDLERVERIVEYIEQNYKLELSLSDIAESMHLSVPQLSRFFRDKMGVSCIEYLHQVRVGKAKELLNDFKHTVLHVSEECGFSSVASFYRVFKSETGLTPTEYREGIESIRRAENSFVQGYKVVNPLSGYNILTKYLE